MKKINTMKMMPTAVVRVMLSDGDNDDEDEEENEYDKDDDSSDE